MARKTTVAAFERWIADEENERDVLERISSGRPMHKVAVEVKQPYTCLAAHFESTPERATKLAAARRAWVQARKDQLVEKVEALPPDRDHVAKLKLEHEIIDNQAKAYHRDVWGDRVQVEKSVTVRADEALLGSVDELLRLANEKVVSEVPAALPARVVNES